MKSLNEGGTIVSVIILAVLYSLDLCRALAGME